MYSFEDRIRAVELYIKLGKRVAATIHQLGYPTKNALKSWHLTYELGSGLPRAYMRAKPKYSQAQQTLAIEHYLAHGRCIAATIKALGYPSRDSLRAWILAVHPQLCSPGAARPDTSPRPLDLKQAAVIALCTRQESAQAVAQKLGVCRPTLYNWKNQLLSTKASASMTSKPKPPQQDEYEELQRQIDALRRDLHRLQLENDLLNKANELIKKDAGINLQSLRNREKTQLVDALKHTYPLPELLETLGLARSSYFYHRARAQVADKYAQVRCIMAEIFESSYRCYGYRRMRASLSSQCTRICEKVVLRLMKQEGLIAARPKRRRYGSYLGEISPAPENLVNRDFTAGAPNEKWLTDISEFHIPAGKVYVSPVIDCFDGKVVSWTIGMRPDAQLVNTMLDAAIETINSSSNRPVVHSDRGAHYRWPGWLSRIADAELTRSMSRKGCSPDNAACEGFFGRLKTEWFYPGNWQLTTTEQFTQALDSYIRWYNEKRIKMSLGARSPLEYRKSLGLMA